MCWSMQCSLLCSPAPSFRKIAQAASLYGGLGAGSAAISLASSSCGESAGAVQTALVHSQRTRRKSDKLIEAA